MSTPAISLRLATPADAKGCGRIAHLAFTTIAKEHGFASDMPTPELAIKLFSHWIGHAGFQVIVAELGDHLVGSVVIDERSCIAGLGPIAVDPSVQHRMVGQQLSAAVRERLIERAFLGARLVQAPHNFLSFSLCIRAGFAVREPLVCLQGPALGLSLPNHRVRHAAMQDLDGCNALCRQVHGHDRGGELAEAIASGKATLVEREHRISGYATEIGFAGHAVGECNADLQALIGAADHFTGQGLIVPTRNGELLRWCLEHRLRLVQPLTLMSLGFYQEPRGVFLPSIAY